MAVLESGAVVEREEVLSVFRTLEGGRGGGGVRLIGFCGDFRTVDWYVRALVGRRWENVREYIVSATNLPSKNFDRHFPPPRLQSCVSNVRY